MSCQIRFMGSQGEFGVELLAATCLQQTFHCLKVFICAPESELTQCLVQNKSCLGAQTQAALRSRDSSQTVQIAPVLGSSQKQW